MITVPETDTQDQAQPVEDVDEIPRLTRSAKAVKKSERLAYLATRHRGQARIAYIVATQNVDRLMHVNGLGWYYFDGSRWVEDTGQAWNAVLATLRSLWDAAMDNKELRVDVDSCQKANAIKGVLEVASRLPGIGFTHEDLDADAYQLNCQNGTLDLHSLELRPHDPADHITRVCNASYDPDATAEMWERFLETSLPNENVRGYLQRLSGLSLIGEVLEHIFTIATGEGRNGKGVQYEVFVHVLGDYATVVDPSLFEQNMKASSSSPRPDLLALRAVRYLVTSETEKHTRIASAFMKRLTGGDPITARGAWEKKMVTFSPALTPLMVTNHLPKLPADDPAVWERTRVIPFDVVVPKEERDPHLKRKLREHAADAVLAWAVRGLADYFENGLNEPSEVLRATADYAESQNDVKEFIELMCTEGSASGDTTTVLHAEYEEWAFREGLSKEQKLGRKDFAKALEKLGYPSKKSSKGMTHRGLELDRGETASAQRSVQEVVDHIASLGGSQTGEPDPAVLLTVRQDEYTRIRQESFAAGRPMPRTWTMRGPGSTDVTIKSRPIEGVDFDVDDPDDPPCERRYVLAAYETVAIDQQLRELEIPPSYRGRGPTAMGGGGHPDQPQSTEIDTDERDAA